MVVQTHRDAIPLVSCSHWRKVLRYTLVTQHPSAESNWSLACQFVSATPHMDRTRITGPNFGQAVVEEQTTGESAPRMVADLDAKGTPKSLSMKSFRRIVIRNKKGRVATTARSIMESLLFPFLDYLKHQHYCKERWNSWSPRKLALVCGRQLLDHGTILVLFFRVP